MQLNLFELEPSDDLSDLDVPPAPDEAERVALLLAEYEVTRPRPCRCERPLVAVDDLGDACCWRCGRAPAGTGERDG